MALSAIAAPAFLPSDVLTKLLLLLSRPVRVRLPLIPTVSSVPVASWALPKLPVLSTAELTPVSVAFFSSLLVMPSVDHLL